MSHLRPHTTVRMRPGGSAVPGTRRSLDNPDPLDLDDWDTRVRDFARAAGADEDLFAGQLDDTVEAYALRYDTDIDVARTRLVAALAGAHDMATDGTDLDLAEENLRGLLATWEITEPSDGDLVTARLALLHEQLVAQPEPSPAEGEGNAKEVTASPDEAGETPDAPPAEGVDPAPGDQVPATLEYTLNSVPEKAHAVADWIRAADGDQDAHARARAALEVEQARPEADRRTTVLAAIEAVLGDGG